MDFGTSGDHVQKRCPNGWEWCGTQRNGAGGERTGGEGRGQERMLALREITFNLSAPYLRRVGERNVVDRKGLDRIGYRRRGRSRSNSAHHFIGRARIGRDCSAKDGMGMDVGIKRDHVQTWCPILMEWHGADRTGKKCNGGDRLGLDGKGYFFPLTSPQRARKRVEYGEAITV
jgi:hypothetical protein